jgi:hypothetical protein
MEVVNDIIDIDIVFTTFAPLGSWVFYMVFLVAIKLLFLTSEALDLAPQVWEHHVFRWNTPADHIKIRGINGGTIGNRPLYTLETYIVW